MTAPKMMATAGLHKSGHVPPTVLLAMLSRYPTAPPPTIPKMIFITIYPSNPYGSRKCLEQLHRVFQGLLLVLTSLKSILQALFQPMAEDDEPHSVERSSYSGKLCHNFNAIPFLLNHALKPPNLPLYPSEPCHQPFPFLSLFHESILFAYTPRGIISNRVPVPVLNVKGCLSLQAVYDLILSESGNLEHLVSGGFS